MSIKYILYFRICDSVTVLVFFFLIKIIYHPAILIASVLYMSLVTTRSIQLLADWAIRQNGGLVMLIVSLVAVIVHFPNCFNNFSRFRSSYMYIINLFVYLVKNCHLIYTHSASF